MNVEVIAANKLTLQNKLQWSNIQQNNPELQSPCFCPEFALSVASVRKDVFIGIIKEGSEIVGFFPFQKNNFGFGRPLCGRLSDFQAVIIENRYDFNVNELIRKCGLVVWDFDHLIESQAPFKPYHRRIDKSPYINLSNGYESYVLDQIRNGSKLIKKINTFETKLEKDFGKIRFEIDSLEKKPLEELLLWKASQYAKTGKINIFSFDWTRNLLDHILKTRTQNFSGILSVLYAENELIAAHIGMRSQTVLHWWYPAYSTKYDKYSPGLILLQKVAESAPLLGIKIIDLGKGEDLYKKRFSNGETIVAEGSVETSLLVSKFRNLRQDIETFVRNSPIARPIFIPGRLIKKFERWVKIRF
jgi:CelD/BcsL family acetyltransferase involved in cellulose biosynthesis